MVDLSVSMVKTKTNLLSVHNGNSQDSHDYLIILGKSQGGMRFNYASIDPGSHSLAPKLNTIVWSRLVDLVDYATCVFRNCLYVIGGREKLTGRLCREVNRYDPYLGRWKQCEDLRRARADHAAAAIWGKIYVFGGMTSSTEISDTCESYEPLMDEWQPEESLPEPRKYHACVATDSNVYIIGGTSPTQVANDNVWMLSRHIPDPRRQDAAQYEWRPLPDPKLSGLGYRLSRAMAAVCKEKMFIIGGVCHGQTTDGVTFIRRSTTQKPSENGENNNMLNGDVTSGSGSRSTSEPSEKSDTKWHIGTSNVIESYKLDADIPDFSLDPELEEIRQREKEEEEKKKEKEQKFRSRQRMRYRKGKDLQQEKEEELRRQQEEEERRKEEEERWERMRNRTFWKSNLPDMPLARCSAGTLVTGHRIYVIGGHAVEDESRSSITSVDYYHIRRKEWVHAFDFPVADLADIECCVLTVPASNKDFKPMKYSGCKWVMW